MTENEIGLDLGKSGGIVKRNFVFFGLFLGSLILAVAGALPAQNTPAKKPAAGAAAARGKTVFQQKCSVCHFAESDATKIGPGLKGIAKRGTFTVNGNKVTDENLKTWIQNGDQLMPPFNDVLEPAQIKDVVSYLKTL